MHIPESGSKTKYGCELFFSFGDLNRQQFYEPDELACLTNRRLFLRHYARLELQQDRHRFRLTEACTAPLIATLGGYITATSKALPLYKTFILDSELINEDIAANCFSQNPL